MTHRILISGNFPDLQNKLQEKGINADMETDTANVRTKIQQYCYHLGIIYIKLEEGEIPASQIPVIEAESSFPKIIILSGPFTETNKIINQSLTTFCKAAHAIAVKSENDGVEQIIKDVEMALEKHNSVNSELEIIDEPEVLNTILTCISDEMENEKRKNELKSLFQRMFHDYSSISIHFPDFITHQKGKFAAFIVTPHSFEIPDGHPLIVKCGWKDPIVQIRRSLQKGLFIITHVREAFYNSTTHFAALAYPAPRREFQGFLDFPTFYREKIDNQVTNPVNTVIDNLFKSWEPWSKRIRNESVFWNKNIRTFFFDRLCLNDYSECKNQLDDLLTKASNYRWPIKSKRNELGFLDFQKHIHYFPNPLSCMFDADEIKQFNAIPRRICFTHGDLRGGNFVINHKLDFVLTGFENADLGSSVSDVAGLEAVIKFHCLKHESLLQLLEFEKDVLTPWRYEKIIIEPDLLPEYKMAIETINKIRSEWGRQWNGNDMEEYYSILFFFTMREIFPKNETAREKDNIVRKLYALMSASFICYRLKHWQNWAGWPGPREVIPL